MDYSELRNLLTEIETLSLADQVSTINEVRKVVAEYSPFKSEPVDLVEWVQLEEVHANDYNPNSVAPPEMELLKLSIEADGYTQPIVANQEDDLFIVVDGFHRNRVGRECKEVRKKVHGYLPLVQIRDSQTDKADRIASTIRHNRARGKHQVEAMSDIVLELKKRNWSDDRIAKNLGMDADEILRLCQITGLQELFSDQEFSKSWDVEGEVSESDFQELTDDISKYEDEVKSRTVNTSDENRVFHTYEKWECYKAGFYDTTKEGMNKEECQEAYREFLSDLPAFRKALKGVITEWGYSCEHYLSNIAMNRIAWLGQASACYAKGIPAEFRGGFWLLTDQQQQEADKVALRYLNKWLKANNMPKITMEEANSGRQSDIY